jgi:Abnormal spindle-like microcephaly-assoc'd, ASPM-SPD-2-Hydin
VFVPSSFSALGPRRLAVLVCIFAISLFGVACGSYQAQKASESSPPTVPQTGTLSVSSSSLQFNTVVVGQDVTQSLQLSNQGAGAVQVTTLSISNSQFSIAGISVPFTVNPSNSVSLTVTFAPTSSGSLSAMLNISSNASNPQLAVSLAGTGENASAQLAVSPASINFGNQTVKTTTTQNVTLQNTGDISFTIQGVTVAGTGFSYANLSPGVSLSPNQQITFQVSFTPTTTGAASATVSFTSSSLSSPATLTLKGDGVSSSPPPPPPSPPAYTVRLTWDASTGQVVGYIVLRSETSGGPYTPLFGSALNALSYNDTTVASGATYYYVVTAVGESGVQSGFSNQVTVVIP